MAPNKSNFLMYHSNFIKILNGDTLISYKTAKVDLTYEENFNNHQVKYDSFDFLPYKRR